MPFVAANIVQAVANTSDRLALENQTAGSIVTQFTAWNAAIQPIFSTNVQNDRVVRNWLVRSELLQAQLPAGTVLNPSQRQQVIEVVCPLLYATLGAFQNSLITLAQHDAVLAAWNATFGATP